jgi:hypothetical protein
MFNAAQEGRIWVCWARASHSWLFTCETRDPSTVPSVAGRPSQPSLFRLWTSHVFTLSLRQSQEIVVSGFMTTCRFERAERAILRPPLRGLRIHITGNSEHKDGRPIRAAPEEA